MLGIPTNENKLDEVQSEVFSENIQTQKPLLIQPKLSVGAVDDLFEHEADAMADRVMRMPESPFLQRKCAACEHEEEKISRKTEPFIQKQGNGSEGGTASESVTNQINASRGGGSRMSENTLSFMESRFGTDFSGVKIHTDSNALQMSRELNAQAFTVGSDIYFNEGKYSPESASGKHLLAHELTHTVQHGGGIERKIQTDFIQRTIACNPENWQDFPITIYFRRIANRDTMTKVHDEINEARRTLAKCCLNLTVEYDWTFLRGGTTFNWGQPNPDGSITYSQEATNLGTGHAFDSSRGLPVVVADEVPFSGGGVTVHPQADTSYHGRRYAVIAVNQATPNLGCNHLAHELWHIVGIFNHDATQGGGIAACSSNIVSDTYCRLLRNFSSPIGDFPKSKSLSKVA